MLWSFFVYGLYQKIADAKNTPPRVLTLKALNSILFENGKIPDNVDLQEAVGNKIKAISTSNMEDEAKDSAIARVSKLYEKVIDSQHEHYNFVIPQEISHDYENLIREYQKLLNDNGIDAISSPGNMVDELNQLNQLAEKHIAKKTTSYTEYLTLVHKSELLKAKLASTTENYITRHTLANSKKLVHLRKLLGLQDDAKMNSILTATNEEILKFKKTIDSFTNNKGLETFLQQDLDKFMETKAAFSKEMYKYIDHIPFGGYENEKKVILKSINYKGKSLLRYWPWAIGVIGAVLATIVATKYVMEPSEPKVIKLPNGELMGDPTLMKKTQ